MKTICKLINKITFGKVCFGWCETKEKIMEKLTFEEMLQKCWETSLGVTKLAKLYQASTPHGLNFMHCVFRGAGEYATILVNCTSEGKISVQTLDSPYLDDNVIHPPFQMTQAESEQCLLKAGYSDKWSVVVLRSPLYKVIYPPLYIYTVDGKYIAVDSTNGDNVFELY